MPDNATDLVSPKILALEQALAAGDQSVLESFWQVLSVQGTPLIEPIEADAKNILVTFIWRDHDDLQNVVIINNINHDETGYTLTRLTRLSRIVGVGII